MCTSSTSNSGLHSAAAHRAVAVLHRQESGAPTLGGDTGPYQRNLIGRTPEQVAHHLPPNSGITAHQPRDHAVDLAIGSLVIRSAHESIVTNRARPNQGRRLPIRLQGSKKDSGCEAADVSGRVVDEASSSCDRLPATANGRREMGMRNSNEFESDQSALTFEIVTTDEGSFGWLRPAGCSDRFDASAPGDTESSGDGRTPSWAPDG